MSIQRPLRVAMPAAAALVLLAGCAGPGGAGASADSQQAGTEPGGGGPTVLASAYPLEWVASQVAGEHADVVGMTPAGAEPHDLELTPADVAEVSEADLLVYLEGFQAAVDDAVAQAAPGAALDVGPAAHLRTSTGETGGSAGGPVSDPHFWLDPTRLADVADAVAQRLARVDPESAANSATNAADVRTELTALDAEMAAGLAHCEDTTLVTGHTAFGYLADRYGFTQVGISGLSPETETDPAELADAVDAVRAAGVHTVYTEPQAPDGAARTVAAETGTSVATLDPVESITDVSAGEDYPAVMRANLATLRAGQRCR